MPWRRARESYLYSEHFSQSQFCTAELELAMTRYLKSCTRCILPVALGQGCVPEELRKRLTYLPVLSTTTTAGEEEEDVAGKIAKIMGEGGFRSRKVYSHF